MPARNVEIAEAFDFLFDPPLGGLRYRVAYGGRGSAKSWQFARALLLHGMAQPLRILCTREFQSSIQDSVHRLLADQIDLMGLQGWYAVQQSSIVGRNGTEFLFKGLRRNVGEIKSTEGIDLCWVEEAEAASEESWRVLIPTIRKPGSEIWVSFNRALETDPTDRRFIGDPPTRAVVRFVSWKDNPWIPEVLREEAKELQRRDPEAYAHVWGGEPWRRTDAQVLGGRYIVEEFTPRGSWNGPYYGADFGFAQDPAVLVRVWVGDSRLYIEYEERGIQWGTDEMERRFRRVPGAENHIIRGDCARPETIHELKLRGLKMIAAPKWQGSVEDGVEHLRSYEKIVIHPRCKGWIQDARLWSYKTDPRTSDVLPVLKDGHDDGPDATRYALAPLIRNRQPLLGVSPGGTEQENRWRNA